jgi:hypothetical protein
MDTHLCSPVHPADLHLPDLREPPTPDMFPTLGNIPPPLHKVMELHRPTLFLQLECLLNLHPHSHDDTHATQSTQCTLEQLGFLDCTVA